MIIIIMFFIFISVDAGIQWLQAKIEINGYEEFSGTEYRSAGCTEEYSIIE